ncbi:MAG: multicopper oxidase family protein [Nitrospiraceae bacterium]
MLRVENRYIEVNGKAAKVFGLVQPNGTRGLLTHAGRNFRVRLENRADEPTIIHWHGLLPPYGQDSMPELPQPLLRSGSAYEYDFPLDTPGTHWMHAHTLQEQRLLAAPLIVADPSESHLDEQQIVVLLHDFSFTAPEELLAGLRNGAPVGDLQSHGATHDTPAMTGHSIPGLAKQSGKTRKQTIDVNDINYDAYLSNDRTLDDPEVIRVERGGIVRLRLINGATATAFWVDLGTLKCHAIAVDGNPIEPMLDRRFALGMGQRIDLRILLPKSEGAWPILALREGATERTGVILATRGGAVARVRSRGDAPAKPIDLFQETGLRALRPLAKRPVDRQEAVTLDGDMATYSWTLNGKGWGNHQPLSLRKGERIELTLRNKSMMAHPMHLHGHHFQVVAIDGVRLQGAVRDTVWVPSARAVTIAFDASNPGQWAFHCHHLYHMAAGMMTTVAYA